MALRLWATIYSLLFIESSMFGFCLEKHEYCYAVLQVIVLIGDHSCFLSSRVQFLHAMQLSKPTLSFHGFFCSSVAHIGS